MPSSPNTHISQLDVSDNYIDGQIPVNLFVIFPSLWNLDMSNNMFEGGIPAFGDIRSLDTYLTITGLEEYQNIWRCVAPP